MRIIFVNLVYKPTFAKAPRLKNVLKADVTCSAPVSIPFSVFRSR